MKHSLRFALITALCVAAGQPAASQVCPGDASVTTLGVGTPGAPGIAELRSVGGPFVGTPHALEQRNGLIHGIGILVAGLTETPVFLPEFGGTFFPGAPFVVIEPYFLDGQGNSPPILRTEQIEPFACGLSLWAQAVILDPTAQGELAFTNALRIGFGAPSGRLFPTLGIPTSGSAPVVGDFDEDGHLDVALAGMGLGKEIVLLFGDGNGSLSAPTTIPVFSLFIHGADLNQDGHLDLVAAGVPPTLDVLLGAGNGTFAPPVTYAGVTGAGFELTHMTFGDLNGDNAVDIALVAKQGFAPQAIELGVLLGAGDGTFGAVMESGLTALPQQLVIAELDTDGIPDLLTVGPEARVTVRLGLGDGTFSSPQDFATTDVARRAVVADFDDDDVLDLAVACGSFTNGEVSLLRGSGDGSFEPAVSLSAGPEPRDLVATDLDGDGRTDLAVISDLGDVTVMQGGGDGTFTELTRFFTDDLCITSADLNEDGVADLLTACSWLAVWPGLGGGFFYTAQELPVVDFLAYPEDMVAVDLDGDDYLDVIVAEGGSPDAQVHYGGPAGHFELPQAVPASSAMHDLAALAVADFDLDGVLDLVTVDPLFRVGEIYRGLGNRTFQAVQSFDTGNGPSKVRTGDLNGDGLPEVLVLNSLLSENFTLLRGLGGALFAPPEFIPVGGDVLDFELTDLDANGTLDLVIVRKQAVIRAFGLGDGTFSTLGDLVVLSGAIAIAVDDLDGDGNVDVALTLHDAREVAVLRGLGGGSFGAPTSYSTDPPFGFAGPRGIALADVDGDEVADLVVQVGQRVMVRSGAGDASFGPATFFAGAEVPFGDPLTELRTPVIADVNQDGLGDLLVPRLDHVRILHNQLLD